MQKMAKKISKSIIAPIVPIIATTTALAINIIAKNTAKMIVHTNTMLNAYRFIMKTTTDAEMRNQNSHDTTESAKNRLTIAQAKKAAWNKN